jgi:glucosamine--fructose-6-phosphate aminotransferase (isomerizing)
MIAENPGITAKLLSKEFDIAERNAKAHIKALKDDGRSCVSEVREGIGRPAGRPSAKEVADEVFYLPNVCDEVAPLVAVVPLQLLAYHIANLKGRNIDQPRNLAKSVTVE